MRATKLASTATALLLGAALLSAIPTAAGAAEDPSIEESGDTVTYSDPALARENTTTVEGTLRIAYVDNLDRTGRPGAETAYSVETADGDSVPIEVAQELPTSAANGDIEAEVVDAGSGDAELAEATVESEPVRAAVPGASPHRAYVVRVARTGDLPTEADVSNRLRDNVLDEWVTESDGAISSFTVAGTATLADTLPSAYSKPELCSMLPGAMQNANGLWQAGADLFPGVNFDPRTSSNHLIMLVSGAGCYPNGNPRYLGIAEVGSGVSSGGSSTLLWDTNYVDATGTHELGHNFSLGHANVEGAEYYDLYSVMGFGTRGGQAPALDSLYRDRLGLTGTGEVARVAAASDQTYDLSARGLATGLRSIAVKDPATGVTYWIDYRTAAGRDAGSTFLTGFPSTSLRWAPGVVIYRGAANYASSADIDVVKREAGALDDTSWTSGQSFASPSGRVQVSVLNSDENTASVRVVVGGGTFTSASSPSISGTLQVGKTVSAQDGTFAPSATSYQYQWYWRGSQAIAGATSRSFKISAGYRGERLRVRVTGERSGYPSKNTITGSPSTVAAGVFSAKSPTITGTAEVGQRLRAVVGTYSPRPSSYRYQWYSGSTAIPGATASSYVVSSAYRGKRLRVRVTGVRFGYTSKNTISGYTATVPR